MSWLTSRRRGLVIPRNRASTPNVAALYPFQTDDGLGSDGVYIGEDLSNGSAWCYDPFSLYTAKRITSPNIVVLGMVGSGKSSAVKTLVARSVGLLGSGERSAPRWVAILDPKGEYGPLAAALGLEVLAMKPGGGGVRLNPLGSGPASGDREAAESRRVEVCVALAGSVLGRELTALEDAGVGWAMRALSSRGELTPSLWDVAELLAAPTTEMRSWANVTSDIANDLRDVRLGLHKLLDGRLRGMFDARGTSTMDWTGRGLVVDLSAVYHDKDSLPVVMVAALGWLQSVLIAPTDGPSPRRMQVWEEIWALLGQESTAKFFQSCQKLSRDYGVANISVAHRLADFVAQSDDGSSAEKVARGLLADTQTQIIFRQSADQIPHAKELLGLSDTEAAVLPLLGQGKSLWRVGHDVRAIVAHRIASDEFTLTDTDGNLALA